MTCLTRQAAVGKINMVNKILSLLTDRKVLTQLVLFNPFDQESLKPASIIINVTCQ